MPAVVPSVTAHPFTKPSADAILISSDHVDFRVHKAILAEASPFFESMFSLPQFSPAQSPGKETAMSFQGERDHLPAIRVTEHSSVLNNLLLLCYPLKDPALTALEDVRTVLEAAIKYDMAEAIDLMKGRLLERAKSDPLKVYTVGCRYHLDDVSLIAAKEAREAYFEDDYYTAEMDCITAGDYSRLLRYVASDEVEPVSLRDASVDIPYGEAATVPPLPIDTTTADVILRSVDLVDFPVHRLILKLTSPVLDNKVSRCSSSGSTPSRSPSRSVPESLMDMDLGAGAPIRAAQRTLPVATLHESSHTIGLLLHLCYPLTDLPRIDMASFGDLYVAARQYEMKAAIKYLETTLSSYTEEDPLAVYFIACRFRLESHAREAAKSSLRLQAKSEYRPEMEQVSASALRRLLLYHSYMSLASLQGAIDWVHTQQRRFLRSVHCEGSFAQTGGYACWVSAVLFKMQIQMPPTELVVPRQIVKECFEPSILLSAQSPCCSACRSLDGALALHKMGQTLEQETGSMLAEVKLAW